MPSYVDREGDFKTHGGRAWIEKAKEPSQSIAIAVEFPLTHWYNGSDWEDWSQYDQVAISKYWFIGKQGQINQGAVDVLKNILGFEGDIETIESFVPNDASVVVKKEEYNGKYPLRVAWTNPPDYGPGATGGRFAASPDDVKVLAKTRGGEIKGAFGKQAPPPPPPKGKVAQPVPPKPAAKAAPVAPAKPPATPVPSSPVCDEEDAWAAFAAVINEDAGFTAKHVADQWFAFIRKYGKAQEEFTSSDWLAIKNKVGEVTPF